MVSIEFAVDSYESKTNSRFIGQLGRRVPIALVVSLPDLVLCFKVGVDD